MTQDRLFFVCQGIDPELGSEPQVAWRWLLVFAQQNEVTVVTELFWVDRLKKALQRFTPKYPVHVIGVPMVRNEENQYNTLLPLKHFHWTFRAAKAISQQSPLHEASIAYVTLAATYLPPVAFRACKKLWWGPVGICPPESWADLRGLPLRLLLGELVRNSFILASQLLGALTCRASLRQAFVLARTPDVTGLLSKTFHARPQAVLPEIITLVAAKIPESAMALARGRRLGPALRVAFVGDPSRAKKNYPGALRLVTRLSKVSGHQIEFHVFAPGRASLSSLGSSEAVEVKVKVHEGLNREQFLCEFAKCHMLVFPSLREGYSSTLLEAVALGVSVFALNVGGNCAFTGAANVCIAPLECVRDGSLCDDHIRIWLANATREASDNPPGEPLAISGSETAERLVSEFLGT